MNTQPSPCQPLGEPPDVVVEELRLGPPERRAPVNNQTEPVSTCVCCSENVRMFMY